MPPSTRQIRLPGLEADGPLTPHAEEPSQALPRVVPPSKSAAEPPGQRPAISDATAALETNLPDTLEGQSVYVVDSHSLIFQVFHALPEMTSPRGEPVGAVFGFTRDVLYLIEEKRPDYLFCAFDLSGPTFRHTLYGDYKIQRSEMPADLAPQLDSIRRVLAALRVPVLECEGYEADDVLATVARRTAELGGTCYLVSGDKDCRQLLGERVKIYNVRKDQVFDAAALEADWGIRPEQVVDFQTLVGDPIDNVPGVPLIGPKAARELLARYETLDNVFAHLDEVAGEKKRQNLAAGREQALVSRELVRLDAHVPVPIDWAAARSGQVAAAEAAELFASFGFRSFTEKMRRQAGVTRPSVATHYQLIESAAALESLVARLATLPQCGLFVLTDGRSARWATLVGLAFAWGEGQGAYVPLRHQPPDGAAREASPHDALAQLRPLLERAATAKVGHDLKYTAGVLRAHGIELAAAIFDTMLAGYLLEAGERNHSLAELAQQHLGVSGARMIDVLGTGKTQRALADVPPSELLEYAVQGADWPLRLQPLLESRMREAAVDELFGTLEMPLVEVLTRLEASGIKLDAARLAELSEQYSQRLATLEAEIYSLAGRAFNIGSPKQLAEILFVELQLPVVKKTKTGASTDADVLEALARAHPLPAKIIEYRQYAKLKNTYVDALPALVHPQTGRIHATFHQVVAATGRLSASDPNLQNIPIRTPEGREIRSAFLPGHDDWQLLAADYSQIELRVLAHFSGDETLRSAFARDEDIHARVASQVYGVPLDQVTSAMRRVAKAVNFGVIYGQSPFGLANMLGIEKDEAAAFINGYFAGYPGVEQFIARVLHDCRREGHVTTILGRRRSIVGVRDPKLKKNLSPAARQLGLPERTAVNTVIQGSAADIIKLAMLRVDERLRRERLRTTMLLQIHDELMFESPPDELASAAELVRDAMAGVLPLAVPLKVDVKTGATWAQCE